MGEPPDAHLYGDEESTRQYGEGSYGLKLPNLEAGAGHIVEVESIVNRRTPGSLGKMAEFQGKDTTTGHWKSPALP